MDFLTVAIHEALYAILQVIPVFIFVGAMIVAHKVSVWRAER